MNQRFQKRPNLYRIHPERNTSAYQNTPDASNRDRFDIVPFQRGLLLMVILAALASLPRAQGGRGSRAADCQGDSCSQSDSSRAAAQSK